MTLKKDFMTLSGFMTLTEIIQNWWEIRDFMSLYIKLSLS